MDRIAENAGLTPKETKVLQTKSTKYSPFALETENEGVK